MFEFWTTPAKFRTSTKHGAVITRLDIWPKQPCHNLAHIKPVLDLKDTHTHAKPSQNPRIYKTGINPLPQPKTAQNA